MSVSTHTHTQIPNHPPQAWACNTIKARLTTPVHRAILHSLFLQQKGLTAAQSGPKGRKNPDSDREQPGTAIPAAPPTHGPDMMKQIFIYREIRPKDSHKKRLLQRLSKLRPTVIKN